MKVLVAFDKFKDCLTAKEACSAATEVIQRLRPDWELEACPLTDGGEGFCEILTSAAGGVFRHVRVLNARFRETQACLGIIEAKNLSDTVHRLLQTPDNTKLVAVVEMAQASGLQQLALPERNAWACSSCGTGQLLREACQTNADLILLGIGGSATNDLGLGALEGLGAEFITRKGESLSRITPSQFDQLAQIDLHSNFVPMPETRIACDVDNPLLGPTGATANYGVQKGLDETELPVMDALMEKTAKLLCLASGAKETVVNLPGAGAAGGIGLALHLSLGASFVPGFALVKEWLGLKRKIQDADLILTGEGRLDESSLCGKGPWAIVEEAAHTGKSVQFYSGSIARSVQNVMPKEVYACSITPPGLELKVALVEGANLLGKAISKHLR
ncbi:MAG: glycerate kinase [Opitutaceae bacterium]|nr:glycerate kinase [Opitutaceae bacterium]